MNYSLICLILAVISLLVIIFYHIYFFKKLSLHKNNFQLFNKPISIIICAKNELNNLKNNLPIILSQNYFNYEVIVVNDQSSDDSIIFLDELAKKNKHLVIVNIDDHVTHKEGKKFALTLGIKTSKHEYLLFTDADCKPSSKEWAKSMCSGFNNADIILGYGSYENKKSLLNKIIRFDTFIIAQQYLSFALEGSAYMGVGRNLAYKKSLFFENKGFASHIHIPSGDDDLFIQEIATKNTIAIEISEAAHTTSEVIQNWRDWIYQKRRHLSTAPMYKTRFKVLLALYPMAQITFLSSLIFLLFFKLNVLYVAILLALKLLISYITNYNTMKRLNAAELYLIYPLLEIFNLLIQVNFVLLNLLKKPKKWNR